MVPTEEDKKRVWELMEIIYEKLKEDLGAKDTELPYRSIFVITRQQVKFPDFTKILEKQLKSKGWIR
jgi:hypothetical protein